MKFIFKNTLLTLFIFLPLLTPAVAQKQFRIDLVQATSHPESDISPRVSPDGRWMAYVNHNAGNFDIWLRRTSGGGRAIQITKHRADDYYPVWMPNSKSLVFVSQRSDALGDIWQVDLREAKGYLIPKGTPKQYTFYKGVDSYPTVAPDGKKIAWVSDRTGREEIWFYNDHTSKTLQLTFLGGTHPCWSPDQDFIAFTSFRADPNSNGDIWLINLHGRKPSTEEEKLFWDEREYPSWQVTQGEASDAFPAWSLDAGTIVFARYERDTNGDHVVSPDDKGSIWSVSVNDEPDYNKQPSSPAEQVLYASFKFPMFTKAMPITAGTENVSQPSFGGNNRIYFVADRQGNLDAWSTSATGYIPADSSGQAQFQFAKKEFPLPQRMSPQELGPLFMDFDLSTLADNDRYYLGDRIIAFHRVVDFWGYESQFAAKAFYEIAVSYRLLGYYDTANKYFSLILDFHKEDSEASIRAEMALLGIASQSLQDGQKRAEFVTKGLDKIINTYKKVPGPAASALIFLGDLQAGLKNDEKALDFYQTVLNNYPKNKTAGAESYYKSALVHLNKNKSKAKNGFLATIRNFPQERNWVQKARLKFLEIETTGLDGHQKIELLKKRVQQYQDIPLLAVAAQIKIGQLYSELNDLNSALREFKIIETEYSQLSDDVFTAQRAQAEILAKQGEHVSAFDLYEKLLTQYRDKKPILAERTKEAYVATLLASADELKSNEQYRLARSRYQKAKELAPRNVNAHKGYIECFYELRETDQVLREYEQLNPYKLKDNVLIYALGLCYSYKGTEKAEIMGNPELIDRDALHNSSRIIAIALSYDYSFVEAYLTISFNYELTENLVEAQKAKPTPFYRKIYNTITAPILSVYRTITFYNETKTPRYYERAIHELTKALILNDERINPRLEASLAMNLANNYYSLGEFGFEPAYENFHIKLKYDSTFANSRRKAIIYERLGHCAIYVEDVERGTKYLQTAIELNRQLGNGDKVLLNTKRLALLQEIGKNYDKSITAYFQAAEIEQRNNKLTDLMRSYRSIAFNYLQSDRPALAIEYATKSLDLLQSGKIPIIKDQVHRVKFGFLGLYLPIPFVNLAAMGASSGTVLTTEQEKAFAYTILGEGYLQEKDFGSAIDYFTMKTEIYKKRQDYLAVAVFLNNIGFLNFMKQDYLAARDAFQQSIDLCEKYNIQKGFIENSLNIARLYIAMANVVHQGSRLDITSRDVLELRDYAGEKLTEALQKTDEDQDLFAKSRTSLNILLAQMSFLEADIKPTNDLATNVANAFKQIDQILIAKTYLEEALVVSRKNDLQLEQCQTLLAIGALLRIINRPESAYSYLSQSRQFAHKNGFNNLLWKINTSLGDLIAGLDRETKRKLNIQAAPFEYFAEAIDVLEAYSTSSSGFNSVELRQAHQAPYRKAIDYLAEKGDSYGALLFAEQMRSTYHLSIIGDEKLSFDDESIANLYNKAKTLQAQINKKQIEYIQSRTKINVSPAQLAEIREDLNRLRKNFNLTLEQIKGTNPQIESLIRPTHIPFQVIQKSLKPNNGILTFLVENNNVLQWLVTDKNIYFKKLLISPAQFQRTVDSLSVAIQANKSAKKSMAEFWNILSKSETEITSLVIVPDFKYYLIPWDQLSNAVNSNLNAGIASSLSQYYYASQNRNSYGNNIFLAGLSDNQLVRSLDNYLVTLPYSSRQKNSYEAQKQSLRIADFIHMQVDFQWNKPNPMRSLVGFPVHRSSATVVSPMDLFGLSIRPMSVLLEFKKPVANGYESLIALEKSLIFAGAPSIIVTLWPGDEKIGQELIRLYYSKLAHNSPQVALQLAKSKMLEDGTALSQLARFQLYGFNGNPGKVGNKLEDLNFNRALVLAHQYRNKRDWANSIHYLKIALEFPQSKTNAILKKEIQDELYTVALNSSNWHEVIDVEKSRAKQYQQERKLDSVTQSLYVLGYCYSQAGEKDSSKFYQNNANEYARRYGLFSANPEALLKIAQQITTPVLGDKALELLQNSEKEFDKLNDYDKSAICLLEQGRVQLDLFCNPIRALPLLQQEYKRMERSGSKKLLCDTNLLIGKSHQKLGNLKQAVKYYQIALQNAQLAKQKSLIANSHLALAESQYAIGQNSRGLAGINQAITLFAELQFEQSLAKAYSLRGLFFLELDRLDESLQDEMNALEIASRIGDEPSMAQFYRNIAAIEAAKESYEIGLIDLKKATHTDSLFKSIDGITLNILNSAKIQIKLGENNTALKMATQLLENLEEIPPKFKPLLLLLQGRAYLNLNRLNEARTTFMQAKKSAALILDKNSEWRSHYWLAQIEQQTGKSDQAVNSLKNAINCLESDFAIYEKKSQSWGMKKPDSAFKNLIDLLIKNNRYEQALLYAERAKDFEFNKRLTYLPISIASNDSSALAHKDSLKNLVNLDRTKMLLELAKEHVDSVKIINLSSKINSVKPKIRNTIADSSFLSRLQKHMPQNQVIISFYLADSNLYTWILSNSNISFNKNYISNSALEEIKTINRALSTEGEIPDMPILNALLGDSLRSGLYNKTHIVFVPDSYLINIPFELLRLADDSYLGLNYATSMLPSLFDLGSLTTTQSRGKNVSVFLNEKRALSDNSIFIQRKQQTLFSHYFENVRLIQDRGVTKENFIKQTQMNKLTFFSGNIHFNQNDRFDSFFELAPDSTGSGEMTFAEIYENKFTSNLTALKLGGNFVVDDSTGVFQNFQSRTLLQNGHKSIAYNRTAAAPISSLILLKRFLRYYSEGKTPIEALYMARKFVHDSINSHPSHWTNLVLFDGRIAKPLQTGTTE